VKNTMIIGTFGLSDEQIATVEANLPVKTCEIMDTDCFSDIVATSEMAVIVIWEKLSSDERDLLIGFYSEIAPFSETMVLIGNVDVPDELKKYVSIYKSFDEFSTNMRYVLLGAYRKSKKNENFSSILADTIFILSQIRKKPFITTKELAEKLEKSERTIQRYIETLRVSGEGIEYDMSHKGWKLTDGKSILWGDI